MRIRDTETGADHSCRCAARWMPAIQEYIDRIVDVLVFEKMGSLCSAGQNTVELPQARHVEKFVVVTVVREHHGTSILTAQEMVEVPQSQCLARLIDVPAVSQRQVPNIQGSLKIHI